jgi:signal peptidase II
MNDNYKSLTIFLGVLIFDQLTKAFIELNKPIIDLSLFSIHYVTNTGASFGMLQGNNAILTFVALMALGIIMMNVKNITGRYVLPTVLLSAGIIGNLIDRLFRGYVVDFIDLGWWPVFNVADSAIFISVIWLAIVIFNDNEVEQNKKTKKSESVKKKRKR